jgi:hypothetical protein
MDEKSQIKYNKCLEETSGLLIEISKIILIDFSNDINKLSSLNEPKKDRLIEAEVDNEEKNFFFNIKLYSDCAIFLKGCFEIYSLLIKKIDDMLIPQNTSIKLIQYISRARLNISNLIFTAKNVDLNINQDQKLIGKKLEILTEINNKEIENNLYGNYKYIESQKLRKIKKKAPLPKFESIEADKLNCLNKRVDLTEKIRRQFVFKLNDENQRNLRLNGILNR